MVSAGPDGKTKQRRMMMNRYLVELHGSSYGNHKTWRVVSEVGQRIGNGFDYGSISDYNENIVGEFSVTGM